MVEQVKKTWKRALPRKRAIGDPEQQKVDSDSSDYEMIDEKRAKRTKKVAPTVEIDEEEEKKGGKASPDAINRTIFEMKGTLLIGKIGLASPKATSANIAAFDLDWTLI